TSHHEASQQEYGCHMSKRDMHIHLQRKRTTKGKSLTHDRTGVSHGAFTHGRGNDAVRPREKFSLIEARRRDCRTTARRQARRLCRVPWAAASWPRGPVPAPSGSAACRASAHVAP